MIAVLSAMYEEIRATFEALHRPQAADFAGRKIMCGNLDGKEMVTGCTGVGKVLTAMTTQGVIDRYHPDAIVFAGIAGALNPTYEIGDIVIAKDFVQHDFDATRFGFSRGAVPHEDPFQTLSDSSLLDFALRWNVEGRKLHLGRMLSGDRFVTSAGEARDHHLRGELQGDTVDMESAAAAFVGRLNTAPFLAMRVISDRADGTMPDKFKVFMTQTSQIILDFVRYMAAAGS
jgi:adenosylhomocysteine/aminodeoxyfutalosine nucleosidase